MATSRPLRSAARRMASAVSACCSGVPCAKLSRATSMPAAIIRSRTSGSREDGPMVATIFVDRILTGTYSDEGLGSPRLRPNWLAHEKGRS